MHHVPKAFKNNAEGAVSIGEETGFLLHRDVRRKSALEGSAPGCELTRNSSVNKEELLKLSENQQTQIKGGGFSGRHS